MASCNVPLCPALKQFRSNPASEEYFGRLDIRGQTGCFDECRYLHSLLGPACTSRVVTSNGRVMEVYYPCDIPLMDGETQVLDDARGSDPLSRILPITFYLLPNPKFTFPIGPKGRLVLRIPDTSIATKSNLMRINFRMRLADPKDLHTFHLSLAFTPD